MNRRRAVVALGTLGVSAACAAAALALAGCPNTASTTIYTPPTGIQIDTQELVAGIGCGTAPGQMWAYLAVVGPALPDGGYGTEGTPITSTVSNCYSDPIFTNLPSPDGGPIDYGLNIYAFDQASFPPELEGCENVPLSVACPGDDASFALHYVAHATWKTGCRATEYQGLPQNAVCPFPLEPTEAGLAIDGGDAGDAGHAGDAGPGLDATDAADALAAEASDGPALSGEGGDAPLE